MFQKVIWRKKSICEKKINGCLQRMMNDPTPISISSHWYCDTFPNCYSQTKLSDNPMSFQSKISTPCWILFRQVNCSFLLANIQETGHGQKILGNIWLSFREEFIMDCKAFAKQVDNAIGSVCASIHLSVHLQMCLWYPFNDKRQSLKWEKMLEKWCYVGWLFLFTGVMPFSL